MKQFLSLLLTFFAVSAHAQDSSTIDAKYKDSVLVQASFPGGPEGWTAYLQKNLNANVAGENIIVRRRQKDSTETIIVSFLVDTTGRVSNVKVENKLPFTPAVANEAKRVIARGPLWSPATVNGRKVLYRQMQSITFVVSAK